MNDKQGSLPRQATTMFGGVATLGLAAILSKLIGVLQKIPLQNIAGDETFGIYNVVFPFYTFMLFIATAGFPTAISKFVSDYETLGDHETANHVLKVSSILLFILGLVAFSALYFGAGTIARWMDNEQTKLAIQSVSFAFFFVPVMSALRGYFQGQQNMLPTGVSQIIEQLVRVITMIALLLMLTQAGKSPSMIAAGAMFGSVTGALAGLIVMFYYRYRFSQRKGEQRAERQASMKQSLQQTQLSRRRSREKTSHLFIRMFWFALPVCLGAVVVPILNIVDSFTVPRMLKMLGQTESESLIQFGIYSRGLPLVQLIIMLFSSISVAFVPAFAQARMRNDHGWISEHAEILMRMSWLIGLAATVGLVAIAHPVNIMLYKNSLGTMTMMIVSLSAVFSVLNIVSSAILQGMGRPYIPAFILLAAALMKVLLNYWLVPQFGINGAAIAAVCAFLMGALGNALVLKTYVGVRFPWNRLIGRTVLSVLVLVVVVLGVLHSLEALVGLFTEVGRIAYIFILIVTIGCGGYIYIASLFWFGHFSREDLQSFPELDRKVTPWLERFRIIRTARRG